MITCASEKDRRALAGVAQLAGCCLYTERWSVQFLAWAPATSQSLVCVMFLIVQVTREPCASVSPITLGYAQPQRARRRRA